MFKKSLSKLAIVFLIISSFSLTACTRVQPNQAGVLMENYGKAGKQDFTIVTGNVWTATPGSALFTVPLFEQRGKFEEETTLKSGDGTEFVVKPIYSYRVIKDRAVDVIFDNRQIIQGDSAAMESIQNNILQPKITDLLRSEVLRASSTKLMEPGGNEAFNEQARKIVAAEFNRRGFELMSFSAMLDYSEKVKEIIDQRNQSNTQIATLDSKINEAEKQLRLTQLNAQIDIERSRGLTNEILKEQFIKKWDGKTPIYGTIDQTLMVPAK